MYFQGDDLLGDPFESGDPAELPVPKAWPVPKTPPTPVPVNKTAPTAVSTKAASSKSSLVPTPTPVDFQPQLIQLMQQPQ